MLWNREEYISHMTFKGSPREMFTELFGPLIGLDEEWRSQGATDKEIDLSAFGWDAVKYKFVPFDCKPRSGIKPVILSETEIEDGIRNGTIFVAKTLAAWACYKLSV